MVNFRTGKQENGVDQPGKTMKELTDMTDLGEDLQLFTDNFSCRTESIIEADGIYKGEFKAIRE